MTDALSDRQAASAVALIPVRCIHIDECPEQDGQQRSGLTVVASEPTARRIALSTLFRRFIVGRDGRCALR